MISELVNNRVDRYFGGREYEEFEKFWLLSLMIFELEDANDDSDLYMLVELLKDNPTSRQYLTSLISYYNGDIIRMPTKEKFRYCTMLGICWFLKDFKGWDWNKIKSYLDIPEWMMNDLEKEIYTTISFGRKIGKLKSRLQKSFIDSLESTDLDLLKEFSRTV